MLDSLLFADNRYHISVLTFTLLAPETWAFLAFYFVVAVAIEAMLAFSIWKRVAGSSRRRVAWWLAACLGCCFLASNLVHAWADARYYVPVTAFNRYLPLYYPLRNKGLLARLGLVDRNRAREEGLVAALGRSPEGVLRYPLAPLRCDPAGLCRHVLLVVIDGMRADALQPGVAPRMDEFAQSAIRFDRHYSGGNSSRARACSPCSTVSQRRMGRPRPLRPSPVLMDLFRQYGYQFGLLLGRTHPCTCPSSASIEPPSHACRTCASRQLAVPGIPPAGTGP